MVNMVNFEQTMFNYRHLMVNLVLWLEPTPIMFWDSWEKYNGYITKLWGYTTKLNLLIDSYIGYMAIMFDLVIFWILS